MQWYKINGTQTTRNGGQRNNFTKPAMWERTTLEMDRTYLATKVRWFQDLGSSSDPRAGCVPLPWTKNTNTNICLHLFLCVSVKHSLVEEVPSLLN